MNKLKMILLLAAGAMVLWGPPAQAESELMVSAAASLTNALKEVAGQFEKAHPGNRIIGNFAASRRPAAADGQGRPGGCLRCGGPDHNEPGRGA